MKYKISTESDLQAYPQTVHMQFYEEMLEKGHWLQASGLETYYAFVAHPKASACVVISQGRAESSIKYAELIYDIYQNGYSVFIVDHQGQGLSSRVLKNAHLGYVKSFDDYVNDLHASIIHVLELFLHKHEQGALPKFLLCHSMGGAIGCLYAQRFPETFNKIAMCAPMLGIKMPISENLVLAILAVIKWCKHLLKQKESYMFGQGDYQSFPFDKNRLSNSETRYTMFRRLMADYPQNQLGGASMHWVEEAIRAMRIIRANVHKIVAPCLVLIAEQEQIVDNKRLREFALRLPYGDIKDVRNAKHEILFEQDAARTFALEQIFQFFN